MSPLEATIRNDRLVILTSVLALTALAWAYLIWLSADMAANMAMPAAPEMAAMPDMPGMDMGGMDMGDMGAAAAPQIGHWTFPSLALAVTMWAVMMIGMMLPSAAPIILLYARVGRQAAMERKPFAAAGWLTAGYLLAWTGFSVVAALAQLVLGDVALLTPMLTSANNFLGGGILIAAGAYQWSSWKESCLASCRAPMAFIQRHGGFKGQPGGALALGLRHGLYCVGCCWALMLLLFVGGIMNLAWIAALAILVLLEKLIFKGPTFSRISGLVLIGAGLFLV
jgi:predicted metal-binding membrane protein